MAPRGPGARDRGTVRGRHGRAEHERRFAPLGLPPLGTEAAPSRPRRPGAGVFQRDFAALIKAALPRHAHGKPVELWWQDEARVGQQGTLTRVWARRGGRPPAPRDQRYTWAYLFGAVCPARGTGAGLVLPCANAAMMNLHLAEISARVTQDAHAVLTVDGAGWHQIGGKLKVPANITLLFLPPYSPELNPVERVWLHLKQRFLSHRLHADYDAIAEAASKAWNCLTAEAGRLTSLCSYPWIPQVK